MFLCSVASELSNYMTAVSRCIDNTVVILLGDVIR